jgi:hypothetical protein
MAKKSIDSQDIKALEFHSMMLGQIATEVEEFCDEFSTTLQGVQELKARYYEAQAELIRYRMENQRDKFPKKSA